MPNSTRWPTTGSCLALLIALTAGGCAVQQASESPLAPLPTTVSTETVTPRLPTPTYDPHCPANNPTDPPWVCRKGAPSGPPAQTFVPCSPEEMSGGMRATPLRASSVMVDFILSCVSPADGEAAIGQYVQNSIVVDEYGYEEPLEAWMQTADLTGDGIPELVLTVFVPTQDEAIGSVTAFSEENNRFAQLAQINVADLAWEPRQVMVDTSRDLDANGLPEIMMSIADYLGPVGPNIAFKVALYEWQAGHLEPLISATPTWGGDRGEVAMSVNGSMRIDGPYEANPAKIILHGGHIEIPAGGSSMAEAGPTRDQTDTWAWNGSRFTLVSSVPDPPQYRIQAVQDGDDAFRRADYDRALAYYQRSIYDKDLLGWDPMYFLDIIGSYYGTPLPPPDAKEWPRIAAYARFRIILIHVARRDEGSANEVYRTLVANFLPGVPGNEFAQLAKVFWNSYQSSASIEQACGAAVAYATENEEIVLAPLGSDYYGWANREYTAPDICPVPPPA